MMTVPVGLGVSHLAEKHKFLWVLTGTVVLEVLIEALQLWLHRGLCEIDDLISGVIGSVIGYGIYSLLKVVSGKACGKR